MEMFQARYVREIIQIAPWNGGIAYRGDEIFQRAGWLS
jgi:hypothetical protein